MALYSEKVMDHFQNPRNVGEIENCTGTYGIFACQQQRTSYDFQGIARR